MFVYWFIYYGSPFVSSNYNILSWGSKSYVKHSIRSTIKVAIWFLILEYFLNFVPKRAVKYQSDRLEFGSASDILLRLTLEAFEEIAEKQSRCESARGFIICLVVVLFQKEALFSRSKDLVKENVLLTVTPSSLISLTYSKSMCAKQTNKQFLFLYFTLISADYKTFS